MAQRYFSNWLKAYMEYTSDTESPFAFHFWTGVSTIAGALRRRVWINMRKFQWTPNFYIILVGPPGIATKSTSISIGLKLLSAVPDIRFGPESLTWQALANSLAESTVYVKYSSQTGEELVSPMSAVTVSVGELGTFLTMKDDKFVSFLIRVWEGQEDKFLHRTQSRGEIEVLNPWLNVIGATTPAWMKANFPDYMIGGGLTSRVVFVYGDKKRVLIPYPDEVMPDARHEAMRLALIADLTAISHLAGPYELVEDARRWGRTWYNDLYDGGRPLHMESDRYSGYLARKQTHIHKLAIIIAAAQRDKLLIERQDLMEAEALITSIEPDMMKVFESIGVVDEAKHIAEIVAIIRASGWHTSDDLWTHCVKIMPMRQFEEAIRAAVRGGLLKITQREGRPGLELAPRLGGNGAV